MNISKVQVPCPALQPQQPHAVLQTEGRVAGKLPIKKGSGSAADDQLNVSQHVSRWPRWPVTEIVWPGK